MNFYLSFPSPLIANEQGWGERKGERRQKNNRQKNNNNQCARRTKRIQGEAQEIRQDLLSHGKTSVFYPKSNSKALKVISKRDDISTSIF